VTDMSVITFYIQNALC